MGVQLQGQLSDITPRGGSSIALALVDSLSRTRFFFMTKEKKKLDLTPTAAAGLKLNAAFDL